MPRRTLSLGLLAALIAGAVLAPTGLAQDIIFKTDGGKLRWKIVSESPRSVVIDTPGGRLTVPRSEIQSIERDGDVFRELEQRRGRLKQHDLRGWYELGVWCQGQELYA